MILTLISPSGERWSINPAPETGTEWAEWIATLPVDQESAAHPLVMLRNSKVIPEKGKCLLAHTQTGWQAILANP